MAIASGFRNSRLAQVAVVVLLAVGAWAVVHTSARQVFTVYFADATKLHVGDKVTVLDVPVGQKACHG